MLNINDTDQPASQDEDQNNQEQSQLEPLPWEVGRLSLRNFIDTSVMLILNPIDAFSRPLSAKIGRAYSFFIFIVIIFSLFASIYSFFIFESAFDIILNNYRSAPPAKIILESIKVFLPGFLRNLYSTVIAHGLVYYPIMSIFFLILLRLAAKKAPFKELYKIALYTDIAAIVFVLPVRFNYINFVFIPWKATLLTIALKSCYNIHWATSISIVSIWAVGCLILNFV
jgi:hypothetical protein